MGRWQTGRTVLDEIFATISHRPSIMILLAALVLAMVAGNDREKTILSLRSN